MYIKYFKYVIEHKKNVFLESMEMSKSLDGKDKLDMIIHAFTHDLSKFSIREFNAYAIQFYGDKWCGECKNYNECCSIAFAIPERYEPKNSCKKYKYKLFDKAWEHHYKNNKHHPEYWIGKDIPLKYVRQMVCDLKAMSRKFGGNAQEYYLQNYYKWNMTKNTRFDLEIQLDLIWNFNAPLCECDAECWMTIEELIKHTEEYFNRNGKIANGTVENNLNDLLKPACDKYNLNIYRLVTEARSKVN